MNPNSQRTRPRSLDEGSVTAFTVVVVMGLLTLLGLTVDGGLALAAKVRAYGEAQEAARDGARHLDLKRLREQHPLTLRTADAEQAALAYVHAAGATGEATANNDSTTVTVHRTQRTQLLALIGISSINVSASATAHAEEADTP
ncbi:pilus assembly protein TadG-related protein [Kitasatospora azatica]|uniref:pilus assembly protein TadG-related protein n=1 Tax=Kitasatospora azatica TaxID=58347 RepID=UPI000560332F|nr:pilus assembly protein TadG-related protein [Kitasatospora azatica]